MPELAAMVVVPPAFELEQFPLNASFEPVEVLLAPNSVWHWLSEKNQSVGQTYVLPVL